MRLDKRIEIPTNYAHEMSDSSKPLSSEFFGL